MNYPRQGPLDGPARVDVTLDLSRFYQTYTWSDGRLRQMERLIAAARADGMRVLVVQLSFRDEYLRAVRGHHAHAYTVYREALSRLSGAEDLVYESAGSRDCRRPARPAS
ncbi:MAG TPA: hypothetical protein VFM14_00620 [Gemmatimonadales bacterium]|nr:hypothetical protein [Gemmatimonadales bacterium]